MDRRAVILMLVTIASGGWAAAGIEPRIALRAGEPVLMLTPPMDAALRNFDPAFRVRRITDYPPYMWRAGCTWSPDCARTLYRLMPREAPFAAVGDFNADGVLDAVMDGDNGTSGRRIVLLSRGQSFTASEVESLGPKWVDGEPSRSGPNSTRGWDEGIDVGLSLATPKTYRSPHEAQPLALTTDGFVVNYFEKASILYYLRDGRWKKYGLSD